MQHPRQENTAKVERPLDVEVRVDAIKIATSGFSKELFGQIENLELKYDYRITKGEKQMYGRARGYENLETGSKIGHTLSLATSAVHPV